MTVARIVAALLAILATFTIGVAVGSAPLGLQSVWRGLLEPDAPASAIVRQLRVPRVLLAFLVGGGLGLTGAALQALVRNPLADPYLLGLSGGAGLGAVLAIAAQTGSPWAVPLSAFAGALGAVALVYRLSVVGGKRLDPRVLLLAGVVVGAFAAAVMSAIIVLSDAPQLRNAFLWLLGGFSARARSTSWRWAKRRRSIPAPMSTGFGGVSISPPRSSRRRASRPAGSSGSSVSSSRMRCAGSGRPCTACCCRAPSSPAEHSSSSPMPLRGACFGPSSSRSAS